MSAIKDEDLEPLIARELASSKVQHEERFKDTDEAKEILRSELKEAKYEIYSTFCYSDNIVDSYYMDEMIKHSMLLVKEAIQVAAMCRKWKESGI